MALFCVQYLINFTLVLCVHLHQQVSQEVDLDILRTDLFPVCMAYMAVERFAVRTAEVAVLLHLDQARHQVALSGKEQMKVE